ncbi:MAG: CPBP family intramembrane metalloprotease [Opitutales bacterium]|nr:CPBP family intramembrane metalloprotease [Opitutales bacterium]
MQDNPIYAVLVFLAGAYFFKIWLEDARAGKTGSRALPGASFAGFGASALAVAGALAVLAAETFLEGRLGFREDQSSVKFWAVFVWIGAAVTEEIIFRGYIVITKKGRGVLWASAFFASALFAILHPFLWDFSASGGFSFNFTSAAAFSTAFIFLNSMWLYFARFNPLNKSASLLPCFLAHFAYNVGVFAVKAHQGFAVWSF